MEQAAYSLPLFAAPAQATEQSLNTHHHEGQLSVDVSETATHIIIRSAIAGVHADDIDITVTNDTVTIRGTRHHGFPKRLDETLHIEECHWGPFSRSIVLPSHVLPEETDACLKLGILTVSLKKVPTQAEVTVIDLDSLSL